MTPAIEKLRRLRSLGWQEWYDLGAAQFALLRAQWRVRRVPVGRLVVKSAAVAESQSGDERRAHALALAISRVAENGLIRPACLVRALALQALLRGNGIAGSDLRVGVHKDGGEFTAHAWVVWRDQVLGDRPEFVARFVEVDDLRVLSMR